MTRLFTGNLIHKFFKNNMTSTIKLWVYSHLSLCVCDYVCVTFLIVCVKDTTEIHRVHKLATSRMPEVLQLQILACGKKYVRT